VRGEALAPRPKLQWFPDYLQASAASSHHLASFPEQEAEPKVSHSCALSLLPRALGTISILGCAMVKKTGPGVDSFLEGHQ